MNDRRPAVSIKALGPLLVTTDESEVSITRRQSRMILALLVLANDEWVSVDALTDTLWPDGPLPKSPRSSVHVAVTRLRSSFGPWGDDAIDSGPEGYQINQTVCEVDLWRWRSMLELAAKQTELGDKFGALQSLQEARGFWRGRLLHGFEPSPHHHHELKRIEQDRIDAELDLGYLLLDANLTRRSLQIVEDLLVDEPFREDIVSLGIRALGTGGRMVDAVRLAVSFRGRLMSELGLAPSNEFDALERQVLVGDLLQQSTAAATVPLRPAFVASVVDDICQILASPQATVLILDGPTDFDWRSLIDQLEVELTTIPSYVVRLDRPADTVHSLRAVFGPSSATPAPGLDQRSEQLATLKSWWAAASRQPTVVLIEDGSRLDDWSRELLGAMAEPDNAVTGLAVIVTEPCQLPGVRTLSPTAASLRPLDTSALTSALAWYRGDGPAHRITEHADALSERLGRAPLWIEHELRTGPTDLAPGNQPEKAVAVRRLLGGLEPSSLEALQLGAILGQEFDCRLVAAVLGRELSSALRQLAPAVSRGILTADRRPEALLFTTEEAHRATVDTVAYDQAKVWHLRAGLWYRAQDRSIEAARHLFEALPLGSPDEAGQALEEAGTDLMGAGSYRQAIECFTQSTSLARTEEQQARRLVAKAKAQEFVGEHIEADDTLDEAFQAAVDCGAMTIMAEAALAGTGRAGRIGGLPDRRRRLSTALGRLPDDHPLADRVLVELALETITSRRDLPDGHLTRIREVAAGPTSASALIAQRLLLVVDQMRRGAPLDDARDLVGRLDQVSGLSAPDASACWTAAVHVGLECGAWTESEAWLGELRLLGDRTGHPRANWQSRVILAELAEARGDPEFADEQANEALAVGRRLGLDDAEATFGLHLIGRAFRAANLGPFRQAFSEPVGRYDFPLRRSLLAMAALDDGDTSAATKLLEELLDDLDDSVEVFRLATLVTTALVAYRLGLGDRVGTIGLELDDRAGRFVFVGYGGPFLGPVDWYRSLLAADPAEAARLAATADASCRTIKARAWTRSRLCEINGPR